MINDSIEKIVNNTLCTGCGTCRAVCPNQAIEMVLTENGIYKPKIKSSICTACGTCVDCCPIIDFWERDIEKIQKNIGQFDFNRIFGYYSGLYTAHSLNSHIRHDCSSGGFITSLLLYLIENKIVDYVVVADQDEKSIYLHKPKLTKNKKEIIKASGSKYIPITQSAAIKNILDAKGKCAFVGLPCHINGIIKASEKFPLIKEKIKFKISLFCGGVSNLYATKYLVKLSETLNEDMLSIKFRGGGWPGFFKLTKKDGSFIKIPYQSIRAMGGVYSSPLFRPLYCAMCSDPFGRLSDISTGDAWLNRFIKDKEGRNLIIVRNKELDKILSDMAKKDLLYLEKSTETELIKSNISLVNSRYKNLDLKIKYFNKLFRQNYKHRDESKDFYFRFIDRIKILFYLTIKKYIYYLNKKKIIKHLPLWAIRPLSLLNILERQAPK